MRGGRADNDDADDAEHGKPAEQEPHGVSTGRGGEERGGGG